MPSVGEGDLLARQKRHAHVGNALGHPAHLAVVHRQKTRGDVGRVAGAGAETPRAGQPVAAVDRRPLAVGKVLAADGDVVVIGREHLREAPIGKVARGSERRGQIGDPDPAERSILPSHFDPGLDHLGERRFDAAGRRRVEGGHQATGPHLVHDRRRERAQSLGFHRLGAHQFAHATSSVYDAVLYFGHGDIISDTCPGSQRWSGGIAEPALMAVSLCSGPASRTVRSPGRRLGMPRAEYRRHERASGYSAARLCDRCVGRA